MLLLGAVVNCCAAAPAIGEATVEFRYCCVAWHGGARNAVKSPDNVAAVGMPDLVPLVCERS